ncbi:hypothetical protein Back11_28390 [Paenibacillus baekrokdamisoli]|uniref:Uncharacterized protein n=1 Tax=Paenibacillus baekrokdamisoli TaxID=1712516 RepID=A0A3G9JE69_9BACL|nr:YheC/YheD family protein [Paenibacillus baekrokdamisoli]MBB3071077.1 glutathione synthase/RimK-type ligase-like ATP-grasp enzyme [Paenibacillus baekrokdamisoli]BBH21494.1 hypothetical protein Back11_28390 [Paenibacillus baekrokdamisoli]
MAVSQFRFILGIMISEQPTRSAEYAEAPLAMPEDAFCRGLCQLGRTLGILVFLFDTTSSFNAAQITGYSLRKGVWSRGSFPLPDVVYDRSLHRSSAQYSRHRKMLDELKEVHSFFPFSSTLPGKWEVYTAIRDNEQLAASLPPTYLYEDEDQLALLELQHPTGLFLKPSAGTHGKGAIRLRRYPGGWEIDGRSRSNELIHEQFTNWNTAARFLARFVHTSTSIIQPYLQLTDMNGNAFDIRALIQKDDRSRWLFTGAALREGSQGSVTSNLSGGGHAEAALEALTERFGFDVASRLLAKVRRISEKVAPLLEQHFGRLAELGLDFGVEPSGKLWLLEANAKPGRLSMNTDKRAARLALLRPLQYATLLAARRSPMLFNNDSSLLQHRDAAKAAKRIQRRYVQEVHP